MQIETVTLHTRYLAVLHDFYANVLGLPVTLSPPRLSVTAGASTLVFEENAAFDGFHHLAFEVPQNLTDDAQAWLAARIPLLADPAGQERFGPSGHWNTTNFYFHDPAGNILEFIARHDRDTAQPGPFTSAHVLNISEVGVVVPDVPRAVQDLAEQHDLHPFNGQSDTFTAVGGHDGMLIVVPEGRGWFPTGRAAVQAPVRVEFRQPPNGTRSLVLG